MLAKFALRTLRQIVVPAHPYLAQLLPTRRCNLKCRFCDVPARPLPELDLTGMKQVIARLDRMGVAMLLITGGEPLIREDLCDIVTEARARGLMVKVNSNGTMPRERYAALLKSPVSEIAISLDGVRGSDLPHSHVGPRILHTIRFLHDNLPADKRLTVTVCVSPANRDHVEEIVDYVTREFPRAGIFITPVVIGQGAMRSSRIEKVDLAFLRRVRAPGLNVPGFFLDACEEYYRRETYDWGCLAGELFFTVQPNGDLWLCQDLPGGEPLNILDPDFGRKFARLDRSPRRRCAGCTFPCYQLTQRLIEPRHWRDVGVLWWNANTHEGDPCRETARRHGWLLGALHLAWSRRPRHVALPRRDRSDRSDRRPQAAPTTGIPTDFRVQPD
jgi:AdoMet-dependent heme synthase